MGGHGKKWGKWDISHKWFVEMSRLIEGFLHVDSDGRSIYSVSLTFKCWGTIAVVPSQSFKKNSIWAKMTPNTILLYVEKFCHWFLLKTYVNNYCYCTDFDLTGRNLRFTTRFWILMTELLVIMNSFTITEIHKNNGFINGSVALK